jgi:hypothetical protein
MNPPHGRGRTVREISSGPLPDDHVGVALPQGSGTRPANASLPLRTIARISDKVLLVATPQPRNDKMTQTKTTRRPSTVPHAYVVPVVRELPAHPSSALAPHTW